VIQELLDASNDKLLVPLAVVAVLTTLAKGLFSLHRSRSQKRKEFLELWRADPPDDLWTEVAIRHLIGEYLPASIIRMLCTSPQAGRALGEIAESWPLLEMDDETGDVRWLKPRYASPATRRRWRRGFNVGYFVLFGAGLFVGYLLFVTSKPFPMLYWVYPITGMLLGLICLHHADRLKTADRAVPRWLGLP
jgi:hypothetical protein